MSIPVGKPVRWATPDEQVEDAKLIAELKERFGPEGLTVFDLCRQHKDLVRLAKNGEPYTPPDHSGWVSVSLLRSLE